MQDILLDSTVDEILGLPPHKHHALLTRRPRETHYDYMWRQGVSDTKEKAARASIAAVTLSEMLHDLRTKVDHQDPAFRAAEAARREGDKQTLARYGLETEYGWVTDWVNDIISGSHKVVISILLPDLSDILEKDGTLASEKGLSPELESQFGIVRLLRGMSLGVGDPLLQFVVDDTRPELNGMSDAFRASKLAALLLREGILDKQDKPGADFFFVYHGDIEDKTTELISALERLYPECIKSSADNMTFHPPVSLLNTNAIRDRERRLLDELGVPLVRNGKTTREVFDAAVLGLTASEYALHVTVAKHGLRPTDVPFEAAKRQEIIARSYDTVTEDGNLQEQMNAFLLALAVYDLEPHNYHDYHVHKNYLSPPAITLLMGEILLDTLLREMSEDMNQVAPDSINPGWYRSDNYDRGFAPIDAAWIYNHAEIYAEHFHDMPAELRASMQDPKERARVIEMIFSLPQTELAKREIFRRNDLTVAIIGSGDITLHGQLLAPYASKVVFYEPSEAARKSLTHAIRDGLSSPDLPWHKYAKIFTQRAPHIYENSLDRLSDIAQVRDGTFESIADTTSTDVAVGPFAIGSIERRGSKTGPLRHMKQILHTVKLGGMVNLIITGSDLAWMSDAHTLIASAGLTEESMVADMFTWVGGGVIDCRRHDSPPDATVGFHTGDAHVIDVTVLRVGTVPEQRKQAAREEPHRLTEVGNLDSDRQE